MNMTPFHAYYKARTLTGYASGQLKLAAAYAAANIEIYPYQIAAARFALRSPYLKGAILCDDGSLGKSYEALLVVTQAWYEGRERILIVVPTPLLGQWLKIMDNRFSIPFFAVDNNTVWDEQIKSGSANPFEQDGVVITTYDFAAYKAEYISQLVWNMAVFEEAHHLRRIYTGENKSAAAIREAVGGAFKLLLTATPMQNSIMDLYGLIYFIDETALPDADIFYKRYFCKQENYAELASRASKYCFRTTRPQVATYVKIPERIPITANFTLSDEEQKLYDLLDAYIQKPEKIAFPKMERYDLALMLFRTFSSSTFAIANTLEGVAKRLEAMCRTDPQNARLAEELAQIGHMHSLAVSITENAKGRELLVALKKGFAELKRLGAKKKALIFTENRATQNYLYDLLNNGEYKGKVLTFNGEKSRDYSVMERFENEATILISTDLAAEGFNLEFCSFIINYDLPYNTLTIEQRINRCHRQGQQSDVLVLSFLNQNNFADVRMLELINKRILQFGGIFGMADSVIGGFGVDLSKSFGKAIAGARTKAEIDRAYNEVLAEFEDENKRLVAQAEDSLFTTFSKKVADSVTVTPQYMEQQTKEINADLWELVRRFFEEYNENNTDCYFEIDEQTRTITAQNSGQELPRLFYYYSGGQNKPYKSLHKFGMAPDFKPRSGRISLASIIGRGVLREAECADSGTMTVDGAAEDCTIGFYCVEVRAKERATSYGTIINEYNIMVGQTSDGRILTDDDCKRIMALPVMDYTESGHKTAHWLRGSAGRVNHHALDELVPTDELIHKCVEENESAISEEIERLKLQVSDQKAGLDRKLDALRSDIKASEQALDKARTTLEKLEGKKRLAALQKELKQGEQSLFMDGLRLDMECERQIKELFDNARLSAVVKRQFIIQVISNSE